MSSHHFVREGQEPALLIYDALPYEIVAPLLEWAPYVMVRDEALESVLIWGTKIDAVWSAGKLPDGLVLLLHPHLPVKLHEISGDQLWDEVVHTLRTSGQHYVTVVARFSETLFFQLAAVTNALNITIISENARWIPVSRGTFEKWYPAGTILQVVRERKDSLIYCGDEALERSQTSMTTSSNGFIRLRSEAFFWLGESI